MLAYYLSNFLALLNRFMIVSEVLYRDFAKDFEAVVKWTSDLGDPLDHTKSYSSTLLT